MQITQNPLDNVVFSELYDSIFRKGLCWKGTGKSWRGWGWWWWGGLSFIQNMQSVPYSSARPRINAGCFSFTPLFSLSLSVISPPLPSLLPLPPPIFRCDAEWPFVTSLLHCTSCFVLSSSDLKKLTKELKKSSPSVCWRIVLSRSCYQESQYLNSLDPKTTRRGAKTAWPGLYV